MIRYSIFAAFALALPALFAAEPSVTNLLPTVLHDAAGEEVDPASLKGKVVGLYFSAHWCPPCRAFTPSLVKFRNEHAAENFEIVFVSLDKTAADKAKYIKQMDMTWLTIPGASSKAGDALAQQFNISSIPALIILSPDGALITAQGREDVMMASETALEKWKAKAKDPS